RIGYTVPSVTTRSVNCSRCRMISRPYRGPRATASKIARSSPPRRSCSCHPSRVTIALCARVSWPGENPNLSSATEYLVLLGITRTYTDKFRGSPLAQPTGRNMKNTPTRNIAYEDFGTERQNSSCRDHWRAAGTGLSIKERYGDHRSGLVHVSEKRSGS